jgi:tetratricopeptide (TPR) repeat protein
MTTQTMSVVFFHNRMARILMVFGWVMLGFSGSTFGEDNTLHRDAAKSGAFDGYRSSRLSRYKGDNFQYYLNKGFEAYMQNDLDQAIEHYSIAVKMKRRLTYIAFSNRGNAYLKKGEYGLAAEDFNKVIELKPDQIQAHLSLGNIRVAQGNPAGAIEDFTRAIEVNPSFAEAYVSRGLLYSNLGEFEKASKDLTRSV